MERVIKRITMMAICLVAILMLVFAGSLMMHNSDPVAIAAQQGDRIWTESPVLATAALGTDGAGSYTRGVAFPYDNNAQPTVYYLDATGNTAGDPVDFYAYISGQTVYATLTEAFNGGNTTYVHANNAQVGASGASYFVIDDGAGNVGWGEYKQKIGTGDAFQVTSGASNFGCAAANLPSLAGVTYPAGSKVFPVYKIASMPITTANANTAKDNDQGLVAAPKGSPLLVLNQDATTGVTIHTVNVKYQ